MRILLTADSAGEGAALEQRFGRARYFAVYDTDAGTWKSIDNKLNLNAAQGAGIQAGQNVVEAGAEVLVSGHVGPKAFKVLSAGGVAVYPCRAHSVSEALEQFQKGALNRLEGPDVEGHWV